jgi:predicted PurR-regulated permease PerM
MLTGGVIYLVMKLMGLAYAEFWGVSIFLLNFIPNIGALVITAIITLFAYFQWLDSTKVFVFLGIQVFVHAFIGNFLETHFLGRTMHLSPLFLLLALSFWGTLWGGMGLFLAVPMTVLMMIVLSSFEKTRFWAILMSENGDLPHDV